MSSERLAEYGLLAGSHSAMRLSSQWRSGCIFPAVPPDTSTPSAGGAVTSFCSSAAARAAICRYLGLPKGDDLVLLRHLDSRLGP